MKPELEPPVRPLRLGITPVAFSVISIFVVMGSVIWLVNLVMAFFRWLDL